MRLTPLDVRKQEFHKAMRGLDSEEVYAFLSTVAEEYEAVLNDNKALRERLLELDDKVQEYRSMEKTLRDTLLTAERVTVEAKDNARREANLIVKEAQIEAEKALRDIKGEAAKLRQDVHHLRSQRDGYIARMRAVAESHLKFIESVGADFEDEVQEGAPGGSEPNKRKTRGASLFEVGATAEPSIEALADGSPETPENEPADQSRDEGAARKSEYGGHAGDRASNREPTYEPTPGSNVRRVSPPSVDMSTPVETADSGADTAEVSNAVGDLNEILDRMAAGQKEVVEAPPSKAVDAKAPLGRAWERIAATSASESDFSAAPRVEAHPSKDNPRGETERAGKAETRRTD